MFKAFSLIDLSKCYCVCYSLFERYFDQNFCWLHFPYHLDLCSGSSITPSDNLVDGLKRRGVTLLDKNSQSPTITSHPDDMVHYSEPRILTVREMARLQSFPDWYEFKGKYTTGGKLRKVDVPRYTQVGNAVPPLFAEQLGKTLMEVFHEV